jgi:OOP family OmpA-OmpF porin
VGDIRSGSRPGADAKAVETGEGPPDFDELLALLVGRERARLDALQARLDDPDLRRRDIGEVLPETLLQHALDPELARALAPGVERAITTSVRQNPAPLADALFPVMGPAIRKAVAAALSGMVESLNRTLELSVSWRSVRWRLEAFRSGKPFAEVVLLHTLLYRVEQVFLIERSSGLLLQHVHAGHDAVRDAGMVSGMLTAIRDFVGDSFRVTNQEGLEALKVGELSVWIEQGPRAVIAAVIRGEAPRALRERLQQALETIHLEFSDALDHFSGDAAVFEGSRPLLESFLQTEYRASERGSRRRTWLLAAVIVAGLAIWLGFTFRDRARWRAYVDALAREPGLVVLSSGRSGGRFILSGLRDPLARDPAELLRASRVPPEDVSARWEPHQAAHPTLAAARAAQVLRPPPGVTLTVRDGVLLVDGSPPVSWLAEASRLTPLIAGVTRLDDAPVAEAVTAALERLHALAPLFVKGQTTLAPGQQDVVREMAARAVDLQMLAAIAGRRYRLEVIGHTDADGAPAANEPLSMARAEVVSAALAAARGERLEVVSRGAGSRSPIVESPREADKQRNRRVTVQVTPAATGNAQP